MHILYIIWLKVYTKCMIVHNSIYKTGKKFKCMCVYTAHNMLKDQIWTLCMNNSSLVGWLTISVSSSVILFLLAYVFIFISFPWQGLLSKYNKTNSIINIGSFSRLGTDVRKSRLKFHIQTIFIANSFSYVSYAETR